MGTCICEARLATEEQLYFAIFCIEAIAEYLNKGPRDVYAALADKTNLLDDYIARYYDALHTQDKVYIRGDILRELNAEGGVRMILHHGSPAIISHPDVFHSRERVDFGRGFYTTNFRDQAIKWSQRFMRKGSAYLNKYELDDMAFDRYSILKFDSYSNEWLDFAFNCRRGIDTSTYDIVMGGVANDKVFDTVELYFGGLVGRQEALGRLKFEKPNNEVCIRNQTVIDESLRFL